MVLVGPRLLYLVYPIEEISKEVINGLIPLMLYKLSLTVKLEVPVMEVSPLMCIDGPMVMKYPLSLVNNIWLLILTNMIVLQFKNAWTVFPLLTLTVPVTQ